MESGRRATVVLIRRGEVIGALPPIDLDLPWWPEAHDVVAAVRDRDGIDITVLRLLGTEPGRTAGGAVSYLAETAADDVVVDPRLRGGPQDPTTDDPHRQLWARPGGPQQLLQWATARLRSHGIERLGTAEQMRTWNLSTLWRMPTTGGRVWLKAVPSFFAHEGSVIDWIGSASAPRLIDFAPGRLLMAELARAQNHEVSDPAALRPMVSVLTALQDRARGDVAQLIRRGVPDRRLAAMVPELAALVSSRGDRLEPAEQRALMLLVEELPDRIAAVEECGVPDTLVHGDFHPGNVAGGGDAYVILDWGDSFVGHPLLDELAFTQRLDPATRELARGWFVEDWLRIEPGSDPARAATLLEPVSWLLAAAMYDRFCRAIEPVERVYHEADLARLLRRSAHSLLR